MNKSTGAPTSATLAFNAIKSVREDDIRKIINESQIKSCLLNHIPTFLLKDCFDIILPSINIIKLVNYSFSED